MEKLIEKISFLIAFLFSRLQGAQEIDTDKVLAGLDAIVTQGDKPVAWATNVSFDEDFELQAIRTLGKHGDRGYKSQGYNCTLTVGTFVLQGANIPGKLKTSTRDSILTDGSLDFALISVETGETLYILKDCRCATKGVTLDNGSLSQKNTTWRCREVKEMNVS